MPSLSIRGEGSVFSGRLLASTSRDEIPHYLADDFNETYHKYSSSWGTAEKVFKVRGKRSRLRPDRFAYNGGGMHFDGVVSRVSCSLNVNAFYERFLNLSNIFFINKTTTRSLHKFT